MMNQTIYNVGGGGGYKYGGTLEDNTFLFIDNNKVYSYHNESNLNINIVFKKNIINSIVNIDNDVACTVNVYKEIDNLLYPISYINTNSLSANKKYKVFIIDDSFIIEELNIIGNGDPDYLDINNIMYPVKQIGGYIWTLSNVVVPVSSPTKSRNGQIYYQNSKQLYELNINGFEVPDETAFDDLRVSASAEALSSVNGWDNDLHGTNASGFNAYPYGIIRTDDVNEGYETHASFLVKSVSYPNSRSFYINSVYTTGYSLSQKYYKNLRLCKKI